MIGRDLLPFCGGSYISTAIKQHVLDATSFLSLVGIDYPFNVNEDYPNPDCLEQSKFRFSANILANLVIKVSKIIF